MNLKGKSCAVTGAGGFIGQKLCERLVGAGADVIGLDIARATEARVQRTGARFAVCDTTDEKSARAGVDGAQLVVHAAARLAGISWGPMKDFVRVNVHGTRNVLDAARETGAERVVHVSSVASFGYEHGHELDEDAAPRPCGIPYIDTKGASDALALGRGKAGDPIVVVRPGDVYGPGSTGWAVLPMDAIRRRRFMLVDGGQGILTPVYVDDLVESIVLALTTDEAVGLAFTVWDGSPVTCAEFFNHYARMLGRDGIPSLPRAAAYVAGAAQELIATVTRKPPLINREAISFVSRKAPYSNRRAREVLGWEPRVTLDEGMRRTEQWFREQGLV